MKIIKEGVTEIYDFTCEEIKEITCPICKTLYEYTDSEVELDYFGFYNFPQRFIKCPFCKSKNMVSFDIYYEMLKRI